MNHGRASWHSTVWGIVPHPEKPSILMLPDANSTSWTLPAVELGRRIGFSAVWPVTHAMTDLLGTPVTALRCVTQAVDEDKHIYRGVFTLENKGSMAIPLPNSRWINHDELAELTLAAEIDRSLLQQYLAEIDGNIPPNRRTWQQQGWYSTAHQWVGSTLAANGYTPTGSIEQFDSWGLTCLMTVATDRGRIFFKTAPDLPLFAHEPTVMAGLATLFPGQIPQPVAVEPNQRWMLLADFGRTLDDRPQGEVDAIQADMIRHFGQLQIEAIPHTEKLLGFGCLDRRLRHLIPHAEELFADEHFMDCFETQDAQHLRARLPQLHRFCEQLANFNIPETLIHGDLGLGNIAGEIEHPLFFDWTEAAIGHPFFDIFDMFFADDTAKQTTIRERYLSVWERYEPQHRLHEAWSIARPLCALYHLISYRNIYNNLESPYQEAMLFFVHRWGKRLLAYTSNRD
ncbi:MAG: aminoglycoside phosphotransferase family protein [Chloroflexota bacterium]